VNPLANMLGPVLLGILAAFVYIAWVERSDIVCGLFDLLQRHVVQARAPDFEVGGKVDPYLRRWFVVPRNRWFNVYLHQFLRDDDDRALHDHPWFWCSILLRGGYVEQTIDAGGAHRHRRRYAPSMKISSPWRAHRVELFPVWWTIDDFDAACDAHGTPADMAKAPAWTLFITGPRIRDWGFHCPLQGWIPWQRFTAADDSGAIGPGCDG
jgi:hypothetical protein